jgi:HTH-type transcriptional regulator / antitoxin HipB
MRRIKCVFAAHFAEINHFSLQISIERKSIMKRNNILVTLDEFIDKEYGSKGTRTLEEFEQGYEEFKLGVVIHEARIARGLTQTQLADKCGTTKAYISKVENDVKDVRVSALRKIIEDGLGGRLQLSVQL